MIHKERILHTPVRRNPMEFTSRELEIIANALMALIENTDVALANVYDGRLIVSLYEARNEYEKLNKKVCLML